LPGCQSVLLLTKSDLCDSAAAAVADLRARLGDLLVHAVSALTGDGLDALAPYLSGGRTAAMLGSSGVGKSTLLNRLAGEELLATREVRENDERGRHTTSRRELVALPAGALLLDTPGMRELQLWEAGDGLGQTFSDVEELAAGCRFADCSHRSEPDCAIREALADGTLAHDRWDSYAKLQRELRALAVRQDARLSSEARRERRRFARSRRKSAW
jgi:ribosome biogenesis GTPase